MEIAQYTIWWIDLDPTTGSEVKKVRPCVVISPDEMNKYLNTIIVAPVTHTLKPYPSRISCTIAGEKGMIMLDQMRCVDRKRIKKPMGRLSIRESDKIKAVLNDMLC